MTEQGKPSEEPDPTAEWLAGIRPGETPWREDRPADQVESPPAEREPSRWSRAKKVAGGAAPYVGTAAIAGLWADEAFGDDSAEPFGDAYDPGGGTTG